jgi:two-component system phosphate regulon sensor histidine kinase PhoR
MSWLLLCAIIGLFLIVAYKAWRKWVVPWRTVEELIGHIARGEKPPTFLVNGGAEPRRVGLALEDLFNRHQHLSRQISDRVSDAQTIFTALHDGLLVVDAGHRLTLANRSFQQLFSPKDGFLGRPLLEVIRDPALDRLVAETLRGNGTQRGELTVPDLDMNSPRRMQISAVAVKNERHETTGAVVLFHDITQLKQADEIRRDFVANVSHELRTPLSILSGYIETLLDDPETSPEELGRILEVMKRHSDRLGVLVDDLLILAQLESTNPNLHFSEVRLSELFAAIVRDWARKFSEKKLSVDVTIAPELPLVWADETRLHEILYNLLDNALKYSHPGGRIRLQAQQRGDQIVLSVSDTGVGISEADLPRIFERFYRTDKARSRELGGTGLGLSIVKHIAQMHGGSVEAESEPGRGTTIRVLLPVSGAGAHTSVTET